MRLLRAILFGVLPVTLAIGVVFTRVAARQAEQKPSAAGFDAKAIDRSVDPCNDFYQFACGTWMKENPIPSDQATWGRFSELTERNRATLRSLLEKVSDPKPGRSAIEAKLGDYYATCMDEAHVESLGAKPIAADLARINAITSKTELPALMGSLQHVGVTTFFGFGSDQDFKDSSQVIAEVDQGGLGLPDRDYYLNTDEKSLELRTKYVAHVEKMFALAGEPAAEAASDATAVMTIEMELAKHALDRVSRRDPNKVYHKMTREALAELAPDFAWTKFYEGGQIPEFVDVNVAEPEYIRGMAAAVAAQPLPAIKAYLRWHKISEASPLLSKPFVDEHFDFYGRTLQGRKENLPRWKRCVQYADGDLGEALGQLYVEATFGADGKRRMLEMVNHLESALKKDIETLDWMTPETKKQAAIKLAAFTRKIGYPDKWRDYSSLTIVRGELVGNSDRANAFEHHRQLAKIGKPVDRGEWLMTPPEVNAYYNPQNNEIVFPAGILQPPFFDKAMDDGVNYGAIGAVIGHEMSHGFDDQGSKFDKDGNLKDWWAEADAKEFQKRTQCIVDQYSRSIAIDEVHVNGKLTLGENVGDNGGLRIAFMALQEALAGKASDENAAKIDGFTPLQRFFLGWGQIWCQNVRPEDARRRAMLDPHSPGRARVNGVVSNMPEFAKTYGCKAGSPMVNATQCRVW
jgi:endothelin-converting enzyme/putative endopeptidase